MASSVSHSVQMVVALAVIVALASAGVFWLYRWKLRKDLLPELEEIDRDIEYSRKMRKPGLIDALECCSEEQKEFVIGDWQMVICHFLNNK